MHTVIYFRLHESEKYRTHESCPLIAARAQENASSLTMSHQEDMKSYQEETELLAKNHEEEKQVLVMCFLVSPATDDPGNPGILASRNTPSANSPCPTVPRSSFSFQFSTLSSYSPLFLLPSQSQFCSTPSLQY